MTGTLTVQESLSGFGNNVIWLIVLAFFIARGFIKTGLGTRIAYLFVRALGDRTLGLGYGMLATDLVLAPAIPSAEAYQDVDGRPLRGHAAASAPGRSPGCRSSRPAGQPAGRPMDGKVCESRSWLVVVPGLWEGTGDDGR